MSKDDVPYSFTRVARILAKAGIEPTKPGEDLSKRIMTEYRARCERCGAVTSSFDKPATYCFYCGCRDMIVLE